MKEKFIGFDNYLLRRQQGRKGGRRGRGKRRKIAILSILSL